MSTSLLYHAFGVRGYRYRRTEYVGGTVVFHLEATEAVCRCAVCGAGQVIRRGSTTRRFRAVPIGPRPAWVVVDLPRLECRVCGTVRQIEIAFAPPRCSYTKSFAAYALELTRYMTIQDVARHLDISWDVIKDLKKEYLARHFSKPSLKDVKEIAIDEICVGKGHRYLTIVLDLHSGAILFVGEGKKAETLNPFWKRVRAARARIAGVAMDMSAAYISAVEKHLPEADIVFDRFHVMKLMNEKLTALRRDLYRQLTDGLHKQVLKGTRWLLLKNPENLCDERQERERLAEALRLNEPLALAYYLKEELREFWNQPHTTAARNFFTSWYLRAMNSGVRHIMDFARTMIGHLFGLLAYFKHRISTGPLEGTNNKIKTLQKMTYGLRDRQYFTLSLYALHVSKYALVG
jgi:transposase